jgi:glycerophosphoryl diester phosphodiesterase
LNRRGLAFLTERPIAHRGLHDAARGVIENSLGAARAAVRAGFAIECDVQATKDGDLVVFHDDTLERLTARGGKVGDLAVAELSALALNGARETIPTFAQFLGAVAGRTPLVVEIKSNFDGDFTAARRAAQLLAAYAGPAVLESFDPAQIEYLRTHAAALGAVAIPLGLVAEAVYDDPYWAFLSAGQRKEMTHFLHYPRTRPDFLSWRVANLPHAIPFLARVGLNIPVTTWTVRSREQAADALQWADQIVFEGFTPKA